MSSNSAVTLTLKEGDAAPDFSAKTDTGQTVALKDFRGKNVVLYFYPKDDIPGCTKQACILRDNFQALTGKNIVVLGVSIDSPASHARFREKYSLPFTLVADEEKQVAHAYGVWGQKSFLGRKYMGMHRVTFLIGPDGKIKKVWPSVKPARQAEDILEALETEGPRQSDVHQPVKS
jgi:peroxiredoxin Q/BCP